jgi:hypothetical protein
MKLMPTRLVSRRLLWLTAIVSLSLPVSAHAATDPCAMVKPEEILKVFGETFGPPDRVATPPGPLAGPSVTCTYKGKTLELTISSYEYLTAAKSSQNWEIRRTRDLASKRAVDLPGVGDSAYYARYSIQSHQGIHDYNFSVVPSGASANKDWKNALVTIARLFYSRLT